MSTHPGRMGLTEFLLEPSTSFGRNIIPFSNIKREKQTSLSFWNRSEKPVKLKNFRVEGNGKI